MVWGSKGIVKIRYEEFKGSLYEATESEAVRSLLLSVLIAAL